MANLYLFIQKVAVMGLLEYPDKLYVEFRDGVTSTGPINLRRHTLTHSDITADLFLTIGLKFARDKITFMRDEVLGKWTKHGGSYVYNVYVDLDIDGQFTQTVAAKRNDIYRRELPLAIQSDMEIGGFSIHILR